MVPISSHSFDGFGRSHTAQRAVHSVQRAGLGEVAGTELEAMISELRDLEATIGWCHALQWLVYWGKVTNILGT